MSRGVNKVILVGNLGNDPETKFLPSGVAVTNITVATSETWKDKNSGEKQEKTEWHRVSAFGKLAEIMGEYLKKGSKVYIEGSLQTRKYQKDGQDHYSTDIKCSEMQMLDSKGGGLEASQGHTSPNQKAATGHSAGTHAAPQNFDDFDDDIPF